MRDGCTLCVDWDEAIREKKRNRRMLSFILHPKRGKQYYHFDDAEGHRHCHEIKPLFDWDNMCWSWNHGLNTFVQKRRASIDPESETTALPKGFFKIPGIIIMVMLEQSFPGLRTYGIFFPETNTYNPTLRKMNCESQASRDQKFLWGVLGFTDDSLSTLRIKHCFATDELNLTFDEAFRLIPVLDAEYEKDNPYKKPLPEGPCLIEACSPWRSLQRDVIDMCIRSVVLSAELTTAKKSSDDANVLSRQLVSGIAKVILAIVDSKGSEKSKVGMMAKRQLEDLLGIVPEHMVPMPGAETSRPSA